VYGIPDDRSPDLIRREGVDLQKDLPGERIPFRVFLSNEAVWLVPQVFGDEVIEQVEVYLRPVDLGVDTSETGHGVTSGGDGEMVIQ
jgi:hypothetical protein